MLKLLKATAGPLKILVFAGLIGGMSMLVSYFVVHSLAKGIVSGKSVDPAVLRRANVLRDFSNELVLLCNAYAQKIPANPTLASPQARAWVEKVARPELQFLQRRMDEVIKGDSTESAQLEATVARCAAMARYPQDATLRMAALQEAAATVGLIEAWIVSEGLEKRLSRPAVDCEFP